MLHKQCNTKITVVLEAQTLNPAKRKASGRQAERNQTLVPNCSRPLGRIEMLTSQRIEPSCIFPLLIPKYRTMRCNSAAYSAASRPVRISGSETTSSSGTPALFKSTCKEEEQQHEALMMQVRS